MSAFGPPPPLLIKKARSAPECYDGTPNIKSEKTGVASFIFKISENTIVTHCTMHDLNSSVLSELNLMTMLSGYII